MIIKISAICFLLSEAAASGSSRYECGPHGRFEYCIDGIPGCVIGCHCHPGYYFDSDTKICEANTKLAQDSRRNLAVTQNYDVQIEPATTVKANDEDLGDWLYNQFFKTIENQVVNKTSADQLTRRSGKKNKRNKKKKKSKRKGKKKLRMDENDSAFKSGESSDGSSHSESGSSSSDSDSSGTDSSNSNESKRGHSHSSHKSPFDHKHFMMINRNRPPLPSFVFLPNMQTPYFPPLGLPPPLPPMFPVLPAPPLMMPSFPTCKDDDNATTTVTVTSVSSTAKVTTESTNSENQEKSAEKENNENEENKKVQENKNDPIQRVMRMRNQIHRQQRLRRKKIKSLNTRKYTRPNPFSKNKQVYGMTENTPSNYFKGNNNIPEDSYMENEPLNYNDYGDYQTEPKTNANFKYLSDLIHKGKQNFPTGSESFYMQPKLNVFDAPPSQPLMNAVPRPMLQNKADQNMNHVNHKIVKPQDESYYINLGREIASLIRKIDTKGERQVNIEIEQIPKRTPVFNDNSFGVNNHWERPVRSPKELRIPRHYYISSEEMLFQLENMANVAATTVPTLDLAQIEEAIRFMELTKQSEVPNNQLHTKISNKNVNINMGNSKFNRNKLLDKIAQKKVLKPTADNNVKNKAKIKHNIYQSNKPLLEFFEFYTNKDQLKSNANKPLPNKTVLQEKSSSIQNSTIINSNKVNPKRTQNPQSINFESFLPFENQRKYRKESNLFPIPFASISQPRRLPVTNKKTPSYFHQFDYFF